MITHRFAEAVRQVPGIELACVCSRDAGRAAAVAAELGAAWSSAELADVLASESIDAVYVASPNAVHQRQVLAAIQAGKHVLVEKPAVPTAAGFAGLVTEARDGGVVLLEAIRSVYDPGFVIVKSLLDQLGPIRRVSIRFHQRSARYDRLLAGELLNVFDPAMAGGALYDLGVYCIQPLVELFGEPESVLSRMVRVVGGADGAGVALASYPGFVADLSFSKITLSEVPSSIEGEAGTLLIDHIDDPRLLTLQRLDGSAEQIPVTKSADDKLANMVNCVERFVAAVSGEADVTADQNRSLTAARVLDAIRTAGA